MESYIDTEVSLNRVVGPLPEKLAHLIQVSPCGVISQEPTGEVETNSGKSYNDGISRDSCSLTYFSIGDVVAEVLCLGQGTMMAKVDVESAYRIVPVHPGDRHLLGIRWKGDTYVDMALPFGMRSAPKIFNAIADALEWLMKARGISRVSHYLDDFITLGAPGTGECGNNLHEILALCQDLGLPIACEKCEGPSQVLVFLGIEVDMVKLKLRLPKDKLRKLKILVGERKNLKSCKRRELESLWGHLCHTCKVVRPGRHFLRGIFHFLSQCKNVSI